MWLCQNPEEHHGQMSLPDVIVNVPLQGIRAMGQGCVVRCPDVQLIKILDRNTTGQETKIIKILPSE